MFSWFVRAVPRAALVLCTVFVVQGCTIHFKAKEVELESQANVTYELEKAGLLYGQDR